MEENYNLVRKLEFARGKIAAVISNYTLHLLSLCDICSLLKKILHFKRRKPLKSLSMNSNVVE